MGNILVSVQKVRGLLEYNPLTGSVIRKSNGKIAGWICESNGYWCISIENKQYLLHRVIWFLVTGEQPPEFIDHKDTIKTNNKWDNFRSADSEQNSWNTKAHKDNIVGIKGISLIDNNFGKLYYHACVIKSGKRYRQNFDYTDEGFENAIDWLQKTRRNLHQQFARH